MKKFFTCLFAAIIIASIHPKASAADELTTAPILQIPIMSDIHINGNIPDREARFTQALQDYKQIAPDYKVMAIDGDFTDQGLDPQYNLFNQILSENINPGAEAILAMGNHEFYQGVYWPNPQYTDQTFINRFVANTSMPGLYYDKWVQGYHFIVLGSEESKATNPNNHDYVVMSDSQYSWLEQTLAENANPNQPIFVFLHEPIDNTLYGSELWGGHVDSRLITILKQYPQVILFTGHTHYLLNHPRSVYQDGFTMVNTGAVAYTCYDGGNGPAQFSQGLLVNVYSDHVDIKAREFSNHTWINSYTIKFPYQKTIDDTEPPLFTSTASAKVDSVTAQTAAISWQPAHDNSQVDKYLIMQNGKVIQTVYNQYWAPAPSFYTANLSNLEPNQVYNFNIVAVDAWKNQSISPVTVQVKTSTVAGWFLDSSNHYNYYDPKTGNKVTGWLKYKNQWYYLNTSGVMQTGWVKVNNKLYYLTSTGAMATGWLKSNGKYYYLSSSGVMLTGWVQVNSKWYYLSSSGMMQIGWLHQGTKWFYLDTKTGAMRVGWVIVNNKWYYFDSKGYMKVGWLQLGTKRYYLFPDGHMAANVAIGSYRFGKDGALVVN